LFFKCEDIYRENYGGTMKRLIAILSLLAVCGCSQDDSNNQEYKKSEKDHGKAKSKKTKSQKDPTY
jgi:hypothetical protein